MAITNIALEVFGVFISLVLLICCITEKNKEDKQSGYLIMMLLLNSLVLLCDIMTWVFEGRVDMTFFLYICNFLVYSLGYLIAAVYTLYLFGYLAEKTKISKVVKTVSVTLCMVAILLVVISAFNHMYFTFDDGIYERGQFYWLSQVYPILILLADMIIIIYNSKKIGIHDTFALLSYGFMPVIAMLLQIAFYGITLLYLSTTVSMLIIYIMIHAEQGRRLKELELKQTQHQITVMLSQIQPHFLYNALNTIQYLCDTDPKLASRTIGNFAKYLRGNMDSLSVKSPIPFSQEIEHLKQYLAIEQLRFEQIKIEYHLKCMNFSIPVLTIQPVVENAIRYGLSMCEEGGLITISSEEEKDAYVVTITDNGVGFDDEDTFDANRSHIGICNTRERIETMCRGTMEITSKKGFGTSVIITIPKGEQFLDESDCS